MTRWGLLGLSILAILIQFRSAGDSVMLEASMPSESTSENTMKTSPFGPIVGLGDEVKDLVGFRSDLLACLIQHRGFAGLEPNSVATEYKFCLLERTEDPKTYGLALPFLRAYSGETVRLLQAEVLAKHPQWTLVLSPSCSEVTLDRVTTADGDVVADVDKYLEELRASEFDRRDRSIGVTDRQYEWLKPRISQLLPQLSSGCPFVIAGTFDRAPRNESMFSVWLLVNTESEQIQAIVPGHAPTISKSFPVAQDGQVHRSRYTLVDGEERLVDSPYWLDCWIIPKEFAGDEICIVNSADGTMTSVRFDRSKLMSDRDLPRTEIQ